jgi:hypothetical protein
MYVVLPSNSSMEYYPKNTLANYKVKLGKPLILPGQYEVALVEIIYPHRKLSIESGEAFMTVTTPEYRVNGRLVHTKEGAEQAHLTTNLSKQYETKAQAAQRVAHNKRDELIDMTRDKNTKVKDGRMEYDMSKKIKIIMGSSLFPLESGVFESPKELCEKLESWRKNDDIKFMVNATSNKFWVKLKKNVKSVEFSPRMANLLGFTQEPSRYLVTSRTDKAKFAPHLEGTAHSLYIYSSVVNHQLVGDVVAALLRVVCPEQIN